MGRAGGREQRVTQLNACWSGRSGDGMFTFFVVTADQARHTIEVSPAEAVALMTLTQTSTSLLWDPENRTLVTGNLLSC